MLTAIFKKRLEALIDHLVHFHLRCDHPFGFQLTLKLPCQPRMAQPQAVVNVP
jgi:hypothetical protein